jgi:excisionase family DNA binding protein
MVSAMATIATPTWDPTDHHARSVDEQRMRLTRADVMTASEVADLLGLPVSTVYHLARSGRLPATRLGRTYRFLRPRIEELLGA